MLPLAVAPLCRQQAALTSRRFAAAACSPELVADMTAGRLSGLTAVRSLSCWLARHCQHVRQLDCTFPSGEGPDYPGTTAACLVTAGMAGGLTELRASGFLPSTEWLVAMQSLRTLQMCSPGALRLSPAISQLTALGCLSIDAHRVEFQAGTPLPPSITSLELTSCYSFEMPQQVSG